MKRTAYFREWRAKHPIYRMAVGRRARAFYREIMGIRVRVNLLGMLRQKLYVVGVPPFPRLPRD